MNGVSINGQQADPSIGCCPMGLSAWKYRDRVCCLCGTADYDQQAIFWFSTGCNYTCTDDYRQLTSYKDAWKIMET